MFTSSFRWLVFSCVPFALLACDGRAKPPAPPAAPAATPQQAQRTVDGERAFRELSCSTCHGARGEGGVGPRLAGKVPALAAMIERVRTGAPPMPAFDATAVPDATVAAIRDFLLKQAAPVAKPAEPDAIDVAQGIDVERLVRGLSYPVALAFGAAPSSSKHAGRRVLYVATHGRLFPRPQKRTGAVSWIDPDTHVPQTLVDGLDRPMGLLWIDQAPGPGLLISSRGRVELHRDGAAPALLPIVDDLPAYGLHQNNGLALGPDQRVYLGMGTQSNADASKEEPRNGAILAIDLNRRDVEIYATGLRNPFDLTFSPQGLLFATDNAVDPPLVKDAPEELVQIVKGGFYGHPYFAGSRAFAQPPAGLNNIPPIVELPPHSSANGVLFYTGEMFPALKGQLVIAEFGSYLNAWRMAGRRLSTVAVDEQGHARTKKADSWATGFKGRPLDLVQADDGSICVADFEDGAIFRFFASDRQRTKVKPSFDCARAKTVIEHAICDDPTLARLDGEMAAAYRATREGRDEATLLQLRDEQRLWLAERNQCASAAWPTVCLKTLMIERAHALTPVASGAAITK